jgi:predicted signal transduction protein with EAL and GGDEF domain
VSFGVTECEPGEELATILRRADDALLQAKHEGRDRVVLHDTMGETAIAPSGGREGVIPLLDGDYEDAFPSMD